MNHYASKIIENVATTTTSHAQVRLPPQYFHVQVRLHTNNIMLRYG